MWFDRSAVQQIIWCKKLCCSRINGNERRWSNLALMKSSVTASLVIYSVYFTRLCHRANHAPRESITIKHRTSTVWRITTVELFGKKQAMTVKRVFPGPAWKMSMLWMDGWKDEWRAWLGLFITLPKPPPADRHCWWRRKLSVDLCEIRVANCSLCTFLFCHRNSMGMGMRVGVEVGLGVEVGKKAHRRTRQTHSSVAQ